MTNQLTFQGFDHQSQQTLYGSMELFLALDTAQVADVNNKNHTLTIIGIYGLELVTFQVKTKVDKCVCVCV